MMKVLIVGLGGFLGTILRYGTGGMVYRLVPAALFPWGTLVINGAGCLVIGFLGGLAQSRGVFSSEVRLFLFIGVLGGFTTFSTFGYETYTLMRDGQAALGATNAVAQLGLGLLMVWAGDALSRMI